MPACKFIYIIFCEQKERFTHYARSPINVLQTHTQLPCLRIVVDSSAHIADDPRIDRQNYEHSTVDTCSLLARLHCKSIVFSRIRTHSERFLKCLCYRCDWFFTVRRFHFSLHYRFAPFNFRESRKPQTFSRRFQFITYFWACAQHNKLY